MSQAIDNLHAAFELLKTAVRQVHDAQQAISDEEFSRDLPSILVCTYNPPDKNASFALLGTVDHMAQALEEAMAEEENIPFRNEFGKAMLRRLSKQSA